MSRRHQSRRHQSCEEIAKRLSDELDGECSLWRRLRIKLHLFVCPPCKHGRDKLARTVDLLGQMPDQPCVDIESERGET